MPTVELTNDNFETTISDNDIVVVDFWAEWCGPCRAFSPTFEAASDEHEDIVFGKVDTEAQTELSQSFGVRSIPMLMVFREKVVLYAEPGVLSAGQLNELVGKVRDVDMVKVHEDVKKQAEEGAQKLAKATAAAAIVSFTSSTL